MSDSDDTDVLLLIPPKFFFVPSDNEFDDFHGKEQTVVNNLISQVNNLETRVNLIENLASTKCGSSFSDFDSVSPSMIQFEQLENNVNNDFDHPVKSINQDSCSVINAGNNFVSKGDKEIILSEIDSYLEGVRRSRKQKEYSLKQVKESLNMEPADCEVIDTMFHNGSPTKRLALPDVDKLIKEMEITQSEIENKLRKREMEYGINEKNEAPQKCYATSDNIKSASDPDYGLRETFPMSPTSPVRRNRGYPKVPIIEKIEAPRRAYVTGDNIASVPDLGFGVREMFSNTPNSPVRRSKGHQQESGIIEKIEAPRRAYVTGGNIGAIPDLGFGVREMFSTTLVTSPHKRSRDPLKTSVGEEPFTRRDAYLVGSSNNGDEVRRSSGGSSNFSRSPRKDYRPKLSLPLDTEISKVQSIRRRHPRTVEKLTFADPLDNRNREELNINEESSELLTNRFKPEGTANVCQTTRPLPDYSVRGNLLSLADLWKHDSSTVQSDDPTKLRQKLEEEKYRRLHLENTIQSLNRKVLEEQEKLAVAMKVDEGKDKAIGKITEAWKQMVEHWKEIEAERHAMSQKIITEKCEIKKAQDDICKKIERWEKEISQALDLAAGFKSKCEFLEAEMTVTKETLENKIKELEEMIQTKDKTIKNLLEERAELAGKLESSEENCEQEKKLVEMAREEVNIVQKNLNEVQAELIVVKEQKELLSIRVKEEKGRNLMLDKQKNQLQESLSDARTKQDLAEENAKAAKEQLEKAKTELRDLYQNQLESVVKDKLAEFQRQLDTAQAAMQTEIENTKRISQQKLEQQKLTLINSHAAEVRKMEMIHKEKMRELQLKLAESERRRTRLENGKKDIAQKLHGVMETQWQQALNIITSELSMRQPEPDNQVHKHYVSVPNSEPKLYHKVEPEITESDEPLFCKDDANTATQSIQQKPNASGKQDQLLKYIQMLLERQPGKPVDTSSSHCSHQDTTTQSENLESVHEQFPWHQIMTSSNFPDSAQPSLESHQQQIHRKPPWK